MVTNSLIAGWPHVALTRQQLALLMLEDCSQNRRAKSQLPKLVFSMNGQALSLTESDEKFKLAMRCADYIQADGQSLVFASRYFSNCPLPERISTTDFFHDASKVAIEKGLRFYFLGAKNEIIDEAVKKVRLMYPDLDICGYRNGYFNIDDELAICNEIVRSGADVLWVGLGKPAEQEFCIRNKKNLAGVGWIKSCGGLFDFLSGKNKRAPLWMQDAGLEWLYRLILEPRRLFFRYLTSNIHFFWLIIKNKKSEFKVSDVSRNGGRIE